MFSPPALQETHASGVKDRTLAHAVPSQSKVVEMPRLNRDVNWSIDLEKLGHIGGAKELTPANVLKSQSGVGRS